ncbi:MAG: DUF3108 domain-containing protein [Desulfocapsaceae bacterium]|nr:DUF3108 domain-containing protein [Desulfocapsaceae bacterium]
MIRFCGTLGCALVLFMWTINGIAAETPPLGVADPALLSSAYGGDETFLYDVSWTGGIKIGELSLQIRRTASEQELFEIHARVTDYGVFRFFYPVDDTFVTLVQGPERLPVRYEVEQKEGRGYKAHRLTLYDQKRGLARYRKNEEPEQQFVMAGKAHNEFSSFFFTRVLPFAPDTSVIVPTFADEKRHEVVVTPREWTHFEETLLGPVNVVEVLPRMTFKGLYDKSGDTVIWFTDDACRVPVRIRSKILIGSLTAELVAYHGTSCGRQWDLEQKVLDEEARKKAAKIKGD